MLTDGGDWHLLEVFMCQQEQETETVWKEFMK